MASAKDGFTRRLWSAFVGLAFALGLMGAAIQPSSPRIPVDPRAWSDTANGQRGRFLVVFRSPGNVPNLASSGEPERGEQVVSGLRAQADASQGAALRQLESLGASARRLWIVNALVVEGSRVALDAMAARPGVARIESDRAFRVALETASPGAVSSAAGVEASLQHVGAPELWAQGIEGQGIVVASADTGVMWDHPALKAQYRGWDGGSANHNYNWWDAVHEELSGNGTNICGYGSPVPCDDYGHGTHTVGTMAGGQDNLGSQIGMAPKAKWIACRNMENGVGAPSTYLECLQFFMAPTDLQGKNADPSKAPDIIDNSYACPPESEGCSYETFDTALQNLRAAGIFMAVSAGNEGRAGCGTVVNPPAVESLAFSVGAVDLKDHIADFSSRGPSDESGEVKPNLVAPGVGIRSAWMNGDYASSNGTSMAAPHVAGAVALLWHAFPELRGDVDATIRLLELSAVRLPAPANTLCGADTPLSIPNNVYGFGRLDVARAYRMMPLQFSFFPLAGK